MPAPPFKSNPKTSNSISALSLGARSFTAKDQSNFAEISGDWNPVHVDPVAARRTICGEIVVHGVHSLLWALECLSGLVPGQGGLAHLEAEFKRQVHLHEVVSCKLLNLTVAEFHLILEVNGRVAARMRGFFSQSFPNRANVPKRIGTSHCRDLSFEEISSASGSLPLFLDEDRFRESFSGVSRLLSNRQIAALLATTRLVGMECPGLHSIYSGHNLRFDAEDTGACEMRYECVRTDRRFSMLWLNVKGPGLEGTITAFVRPRPQAQARIEAVQAHVTQNEFAEIRALVIGGSRGLGEITAKIIAAGGGDVWTTYHRGKEDAARVTNEIRSTGFKCTCLAFDVTDSSDLLIGQLGAEWKPNQLYYFATPPISLEKQNGFSSEKFQTYCSFYVDGFFATVHALFSLEIEPLSIFYPSTIYLQEVQEGASEYCAAKAAGEVICRYLDQKFPQVSVTVRRLRRMKTDQTSTLMAMNAEDPLLEMLEAIRAMPLPREGQQ